MSLFHIDLGAAIRNAQAQQIRKAEFEWSHVPGYLIACLQRSYQISASALARSGVGPNDVRVVPYLQQCQQSYADAQAAAQQAAAAQAERNRQAQAQAEEAERARQAEAAKEEQQREEEARAEEEKRIAEARARRIADLNSRFPADQVQKILRGEVSVGWTPAAVREALGPPDDIVRTPNGGEMWSYNSKEVIFASGHVTYVGAR